MPVVTLTGTRAGVAGWPDPHSYLVRDAVTWHRTLLSVTNTWRWTETDTTYDSYGDPTLARDLGDISTSADDVCTKTLYTRNTTGTNYLVDYPLQDLVYDCAVTPVDADYVGGHDYYYDGATAWGAAPIQGLLTHTDVMTSITSGQPSMTQKSATTYDTYGRPTATYNQSNVKTSGTAYTPATGGPVTATVDTNALGWTATTNVEPGHGSTTSTVDVNGKVTTAAYDPLGRLMKVWANDRPSTGTPDLQYTYTLSGTGPNVIQTQKLGPTGTQVSSYSLFDGQVRLRQTQDPTPVANGGRMITDTTYDSRGLKAKSSTFYNNAAGPSAILVTFADTAVPTQDRYTYDNLERETTDAFYSLGVQQWQTLTTYQGDREATIAPTGGITTQKILDADGKTTQLRQYTSTNLLLDVSPGEDERGHVRHPR